LCCFGEHGSAGEGDGTEDWKGGFGSLLEEVATTLEFFVFLLFHISNDLGLVERIPILRH